jgi:hypothetical protein
MMNRGNISAIATYATQSGTRRIFKCSRCGETFSETCDTVFFDLRTEEEKVMMALKMLRVRLDALAVHGYPCIAVNHVPIMHRIYATKKLTSFSVLVLLQNSELCTMEGAA